MLRGHRGTRGGVRYRTTAGPAGHGIRADHCRVRSDARPDTGLWLVQEIYPAADGVTPSIRPTGHHRRLMIGLSRTLNATDQYPIVTHQHFRGTFRRATFALDIRVLTDFLAGRRGGA